MSKFLLCKPTDPIDCPETFALRVSGWIDHANIGDPRAPILAKPPGGLRLRWNCPFPKLGQGYPSRFHVLRTDAIDKHRLFIPDPKAGHRPRTLALASFWSDAQQQSDVIFTAGPQPCAAADAIYFELQAGAGALGAVLTDVTGTRRIHVDLAAKNSFYFEMSAFHKIVFSRPPHLANPIRLLILGNRDLTKWDLNPKTIAVVNSKIWTEKDFQAVGERLTNRNGESYVTLPENDWNQIRQFGHQAIESCNAGKVPEHADLDPLDLAAADRWEAALLMGLGFVDGEHPLSPKLDQINTDLMLKSGTDEVFGYQIKAEIDATTLAPARTFLSSAFFALSAPLELLSRPTIRTSKQPGASSKLAKIVAPGPKEDEPIISKDPAREEVYCAVGYELETSNVCNERFFVSPMASPSKRARTAFENAGSYEVTGNASVLRQNGNVRTYNCSFDYKIPFFDSTVWLAVAVGDAWDRYLACPSSPPEKPIIDYAGVPPQLSSAVCDAPKQTINLELMKLMDKPAWRADRLAQLCHGQIGLLVKRPDVERLEFTTFVGTALLQPNGCWGAVLVSPPPEVHREGLIDGIFSVAGFDARIVGFSSTVSGAVICEFEANPRCAGEALYQVDNNGKQEAIIREADGSKRLWKSIGAVRLDDDGRPLSTTWSAKISEIELEESETFWFKESKTFWFATQMRVQLDDRTYFGIVSPPMAAPYLQQSPKSPTKQVRIRQLGNDYYGRGVLRLDPPDGETFDADLGISIIGAAGRIANSAELSSLHGKGLFGSQVTNPSKQHATSYSLQVAFQAFSGLTQISEGSDFTLGIANVRNSDSSESSPRLVSFTVRTRDNFLIRKD